MASIYVFKCVNDNCKHKNEKVELWQAMNDKHEAVCEYCQEQMVRIYTFGGIAFKGSGFHINDYGKGT